MTGEMGKLQLARWMHHVEKRTTGDNCTNQDGTAQNRRPTPSQRSIQHNGQCFVGDHITEKQSNQHPMFSLLQKTEYASRVFSFPTVAGGLNDLQINLILYIAPVVSVYRTVPDDHRREWGKKHTWPIKAIVRPANAPPLNTRAAAIPKYSHRPGSLPVLGGSSERAIKGEDGGWIVGAAESRGS